MEYKILIVDDSVLMRAALKRTISMAGIEVSEIYEAANGCDALEILNEQSVDIVLSDLNMPEMNGFELIAEMKRTPELADIPVIVISTESSLSRIDDLREKGIKDYLHKPFTAEDFRDVVLRNLEVCNAGD